MAHRHPFRVIQKPERYRAELRIFERSGYRQQHLFEKAEPHRGARFGTAHYTSHLALDGAEHAAASGKNGKRNYRLEKPSNQAADLFHDDDKVLEHTRGKIR
jgi:hypothetical protein